MFLLLLEVLTVLIFVFLVPNIQDLIHWLILVGVNVRVSKYDVDYGVSLSFP